jgi:hypothetical protein
MIDAGISTEHADSVVAACGLAIAALARLGRPSWTMIQLATSVEPQRRRAALAATRTQARKYGCSAMLDHVLDASRLLVRSADGLRDCPDLDALLDAVDDWVAAAIMVGRIDPEIAAVLAAPQHALTCLLRADPPASAEAGPFASAVGASASATGPSAQSAAPRHGPIIRPRQRPAMAELGG